MKWGVLAFSIVAILVLTSCQAAPVGIPTFTETELDLNLSKDETATGLVDVDGKLAYTIRKGGLRSLIFDGVDVSEPYERAGDATNVDGKLAFSAVKDRKSIVVYDGQEVSVDYNWAASPFEIDGKLGYRAVQGTESLFVIDGTEYFVKEGYRRHGSDPLLIGDSFVYMASKDGVNRVLFDNEELDLTYDFVIDMEDVNDKLALGVNVGGKDTVIFDGEDVGATYDRAIEPVDLDGKLAFRAFRENRSFFVYGGKEYGAGYQHTLFPITVGNDFYYSAREGTNEFFIVHDGIEGPIHYLVVDLLDVNGVFTYYGEDEPEEALAFYNARVAELNAMLENGTISQEYAFEQVALLPEPRKRFFRYGEHEVVLNYDGISKPIVSNGKIMFIGFRDDSGYFVQQN